jgi:hypothetical protein
MTVLNKNKQQEEFKDGQILDIRTMSQGSLNSLTQAGTGHNFDDLKNKGRRVDKFVSADTKFMVDYMEPLYQYDISSMKVTAKEALAEGEGRYGQLRHNRISSIAFRSPAIRDYDSLKEENQSDPDTVDNNTQTDEITQ